MTTHWIPIKKKFGAKVTITRRELGITQEELAAEMKLHVSELEELERGGASDIVIIRLLCEKFGWDINEEFKTINLKELRSI